MSKWQCPGWRGEAQHVWVPPKVIHSDVSEKSPDKHQQAEDKSPFPLGVWYHRHCVL